MLALYASCFGEGDQDGHEAIKAYGLVFSVTRKYSL